MRLLYQAVRALPVPRIGGWTYRPANRYGLLMTDWYPVPSPNTTADASGT